LFSRSTLKKNSHQAHLNQI